jgi:hypothetical protein
VLNIKTIGSSDYILFIVQGTLEKRRCERKGSQGNAQNPNAPIGVQKPNGGKYLEGNLEGNKTTHLRS